MSATNMGYFSVDLRTQRSHKDRRMDLSRTISSGGLTRSRRVLTRAQRVNIRRMPSKSRLRLLRDPRESMSRAHMASATAGVYSSAYRPRPVYLTR